MTATEVREKPILFSAPMIQAILAGRKTQTRRVVKLRKGQAIDNGAVFSAADPFAMVWPHGKPGDRLWVRESFCQKFENGYPVYNAEGNLDPSCYHYAADGVEVYKDDGNGGTEYRKDGTVASPWSSPIHMPHWASRITLAIESVRVERLRDIPFHDIRAEGIDCPEHDGPGYFCVGECSHLRAAFKALWESINGADSWDASPWVWVISFRREV